MTGEQSLSIFVFAALPVTLLTLLSKSDLGKARIVGVYSGRFGCRGVNRVRVMAASDGLGGSGVGQMACLD